MNMKMDEFHFIKILAKGKKKKKSWGFEKKLLKKHKSILSIDEAGRGALAGPLCLGAIFLERTSLKILEKYKVSFFDSKELSHQVRESYFKIIKKLGIPYKAIFISNKTIDKQGINLAFLKGLNKLKNFFKPEIVILDGKKIEGIEKAIFIIKGDKKINSLGAASIVAKVSRDKYMINLAKKINFYEWQINKGYGTKKHFELIKKFGISKYHRLSFLSKLKANKVKEPFVELA